MSHEVRRSFRNQARNQALFFLRLSPIDANAFVWCFCVPYGFCVARGKSRGRCDQRLINFLRVNKQLFVIITLNNITFNIQYFKYYGLVSIQHLQQSLRTIRSNLEQFVFMLQNGRSHFRITSFTRSTKIETFLLYFFYRLSLVWPKMNWWSMQLIHFGFVCVGFSSCYSGCFGLPCWPLLFWLFGRHQNALHQLLYHGNLLFVS